MIYAIALDDEPLSLDLTEAFCERHGGVKLLRKFTSPAEAMKYLRKFPVDLIFLDIHMPNVSGIGLAHEIDASVKVIFTTAYSQYAVESYELSALDYLLKPFEYERFEKAIAKVKPSREEKAEDGFLSIRADYRLHKIGFDEIALIEVEGDYIKLFTSEKSPLVVRMTMQEILNRLPVGKFIRVHRSYLLPVNAVKIVRDRKIVLENREIPIGIRFEKEVMQLFRA